MENRNYSLEELSVMTSYTTRTLRTYIKNGLLHGSKVNGKWTFSETDLSDFFSNDFIMQGIQVKSLVRKYIEAHDEYGFIPQFISVDHIDGNTYVVHAYDNGDGMSMTYNWYDVNKITGKVKEVPMY